MRVTDSVYMLVVPFVMQGQTQTLHLSLILDEAQGATLVDTGVPQMSGIIEEALGEAGLRVRDLRRILITHQDMDHVGSLHDLVQASGARVLAHSVEVPYLDGTLTPLKWAALEAMPGLRPVLEAHRFTPVDEQVEEGTLLDLAGGARVIYTPGHTPGHLSLYLEREQVLIAGDALTAEAGQLRGPNPQATLDLPLAWQSVTKLATLPVQHIICHHGGLVSENAHAQLQEVARLGATPAES